ncbi:MAG: hypothetical protein IAG13_17240 [Deltaproteobacteria bacterium]|nr:hypothetical protein [Nannocystaceae bacterium]
MSDLHEPVRWLDDLDDDDELRVDLGLARAALTRGLDHDSLLCALRDAIADQDAALPAASGSGFRRSAPF